MQLGNDIGYIKKYTGELQHNFFDDLADRLYKRGVLAVFCLHEGCKACEDCMVMIENMKQDLIRRPVNMVVAWGIKADKPPHREKITLDGSGYIPQVNFEWDRISTHGFALLQSSVDVLVFEDNHTPRTFAYYVKMIYRRLSTSVMTANRISILDDLNAKSRNAIVVEHPSDIPDKDMLTLENYFSQLKRKYNYVPYFVESGNSKIHLIQQGDTAHVQEELDLKKFYASFKKTVG